MKLFTSCNLVQQVIGWVEVLVLKQKNFIFIPILSTLSSITCIVFQWLLHLFHLIVFLLNLPGRIPALDGFSGVFIPTQLGKHSPCWLVIPVSVACSLLCPQCCPQPFSLFFSSLRHCRTFKDQSFLLHVTYRYPPPPANRSANQHVSTLLLPSFPFVSVKEGFFCFS